MGYGFDVLPARLTDHASHNAMTAAIRTSRTVAKRSIVPEHECSAALPLSWSIAPITDNQHSIAARRAADYLPITVTQVGVTAILWVPTVGSGGIYDRTYRVFTREVSILMQAFTPQPGREKRANRLFTA
jgi:hypothetical protein